jgi:hypothetical protein
MEIKNDCINCIYFFNCQLDGTDIHEFCSTHPEALGYCELWNGPLKNDIACHGWALR